MHIFHSLLKNNGEWGDAMKLFAFGMMIVCLHALPYFLLGEDAHMRVHDNLDSNIAWYRVLARSGELFGSVHATIPQVINGLPRNAYGTEFSGIVWLHALFPSVYAYGLSQLLTRLFAFIGMYLLLNTHVLKEKEAEWIRVGVALAFALTPFWPSGMLSTLGMPLALWALLNIRAGDRSLKNYVVLTLLPFYSSFVLGFFFFLSAMFIFWAFDAWRRRPNVPLLLALIYMTVLYLAIEYRLVHSFLFATEPTSRDEYVHARLPLWRSLRLTLKNYMFGHTHVMTIHTLIILPITLIALYIVWRKTWWQQERLFWQLHIVNVALSAWYAFWFYKGWLPATEAFPFLDRFNFARYHFLRPMVIYVLFALSLRIIWRAWDRGIVSFAIASQLVVAMLFHEQIVYRDKPTFRAFYAEKQFEQVKRYIGKPLHTYRVVSIGMHPAIAQYNGFYTLDTYNNFYPLSYKHQFRKIIASELAKNKKLKQYFDEWGGRCYIFVDELGKHYMFTKQSNKRIRHLKLHTDVLYDMGGRYVFSALPIDNAKENNLKLLRTFEHDESAWNIYLYEVEREKTT
ncbi:DUF6044 family protein [Anoxybacillus sp. MB8]|uniref:DUF6044 family protein n=1 Tax=Anoxybacillus gonensis TaxID=198467 RepID=UPI0013D81DF3